MKTRMVAVTAWMAVLGLDAAFAGFFQIIPNPPPANAVPEIDGSGAIAVIAIVMSLGAIVVSRLKTGR